MQIGITEWRKDGCAVKLLRDCDKGSYYLIGPAYCPAYVQLPCTVVFLEVNMSYEDYNREMGCNLTNI